MRKAIIASNEWKYSQTLQQQNGLKGHAQAKIIKKSVILFWLINMTIWCKHVHRLELQKFFNFCAAHLPVRLDIKTTTTTTSRWVKITLICTIWINMHVNFVKLNANFSYNFFSKDKQNDWKWLLFIDTTSIMRVITSYSAGTDFRRQNLTSVDDD